jgi:hypothetical protein
VALAQTTARHRASASHPPTLPIPRHASESVGYPTLERAVEIADNAHWFVLFGVLGLITAWRSAFEPETRIVIALLSVVVLIAVALVVTARVRGWSWGARR